MSSYIPLAGKSVWHQSDMSYSVFAEQLRVLHDRGDGYFRHYFDCRCHKSTTRIVYIIGEVYRGCSKRRSGWDGRGAYLSGGEGGEGDRDSAKGGSLIDVDMTYERGKEG